MELSKWKKLPEEKQKQLLEWEKWIQLGPGLSYLAVEKPRPQAEQRTNRQKYMATGL